MTASDITKLDLIQLRCSRLSSQAMGQNDLEAYQEFLDSYDEFWAEASLNYPQSLLQAADNAPF